MRQRVVPMCLSRHVSDRCMYNLGKIMEVLEQLVWYVKAEAYYSKLHECRLVTNVYKHGDGRTFGHLKNDYPEYFPLNSNNYYFSNYTDFADLTVNNTQ